MEKKTKNLILPFLQLTCIFFSTMHPQFKLVYSTGKGIHSRIHSSVHLKYFGEKRYISSLLLYVYINDSDVIKKKTLKKKQRNPLGWDTHQQNKLIFIKINYKNIMKKVSFSQYLYLYFQKNHVKKITQALLRSVILNFSSLLVLRSQTVMKPSCLGSRGTHFQTSK